MFKKENLLFIILAGFFICNALIAEMIGGKLFSVEKILGIEPANLSLFGIEGLSFNMTAGVILWPFVFILTDIVNEYYGIRGVKIISWLGAGLISYAFVMVAIAMWLPPADFWVNNILPDGILLNMEVAFDAIFGQGLWIIVGSIIAFLIGQMVDAYVFRGLKRWSGPRMVWLRATGSTLVSQLLDSFVVIFIAFYIGKGWPFSQVMAIALVGYIYKFCAALAITPLLYGIHWAVDSYLGKELSEKMILEAASGK